MALPRKKLPARAAAAANADADADAPRQAQQQQQQQQLDLDALSSQIQMQLDLGAASHAAATAGGSNLDDLVQAVLAGGGAAHADGTDMAALFTADSAGDMSASDADATAVTEEVLEAKIARERRRYLNPTPDDEEALARDLDARIIAGRGECIIDIGASDDDGTPLKFSQADLTRAVATLHRIASTRLGARATLLGAKTGAATPQTVESVLASVTGGGSVVENEDAAANASMIQHQPKDGKLAYVLVRRQPEKVEDVLEVRVAVCGNVDAGKSTLLGVLTRNALDDGRGKARAVMFKHAHEAATGRTSSLGMELVGFDAAGGQVGVAYNRATDHMRAADDGDEERPAGALQTQQQRTAGWDEIAQKSAKILTFIDLAGHEKYLKTTVFGLSGTAPDFAMLVVGANMGLIGMTREHLGLSLALNVPVLVVVTKVDMCPANVLEATLKQLVKVLKSPGCKKLPLFIRTPEDAVKVSASFVSDRVCPIFLVSSVQGTGLPVLRSFLNLLPLRAMYDAAAPVEYQISETFSVPGVGTVVSGTVMSGVVHVGDTLLLGPDPLGAWIPTQVKGVHIKRCPVPLASAGHTASFALKKIKRAQLRKGMVLVSKEVEPMAVREFEAEVLVLAFHSTTIKRQYQAMLHVGNVRQTVALVDMDRSVLRSGERARVRFRFVIRPEYIKVGARILFREGRCKGVGKVSKLFAPGEAVQPYAHVDSPVPTATVGVASAPSSRPATGATTQPPIKVATQVQQQPAAAAAVGQARGRTASATARARGKAHK